MLEAMCHEQSCFVTLTYGPEQLPLVNGVPTLVPHHVSTWVKRIRSLLPEMAIRFYAVGEYGDKSGRPHYHVALFGAGQAELPFYLYAWQSGLVHVSQDAINPHLAQYLGGYITKKLTKFGDERLGERYPEFSRMSLCPGIGQPAVKAICDTIEHFKLKEVPRQLRHGSKLWPLGRYLMEEIHEATGLPLPSSEEYQHEMHTLQVSIPPRARYCLADMVLTKNEGASASVDARHKIFSSTRWL